MALHKKDVGKYNILRVLKDKGDKTQREIREEIGPDKISKMHVSRCLIELVNDKLVSYNAIGHKYHANGDSEKALFVREIETFLNDGAGNSTMAVTGIDKLPLKNFLLKTTFDSGLHAELREDDELWSEIYDLHTKIFAKIEQWYGKRVTARKNRDAIIADKILEHKALLVLPIVGFWNYDIKKLEWAHQSPQSEG